MQRHKMFGLEREEWCKYAALVEMYNSIETYLVDSNVATKLDTPVWMDKDGNITTKDDSFMVPEVRYHTYYY